MTDELPIAWMGYATADKKDRHHVFAVRICGWCPDKDLADALALKGGFAISHGMCVDCYAKMMRALIPEGEPIPAYPGEDVSTQSCTIR